MPVRRSAAGKQHGRLGQRGVRPHAEAQFLHRPQRPPARGSQSAGGNYTRFICIAAKPEVYPGADRTSLLVTLSNEPGSLYQVLARIYGRGINLTKLESRPIPGSDDTFRFYFDLEASVYSPELPKLLGELESVCEHVCYLGSYSETV